jgi:peptide/nickel transport system substrate-binding protein
MLLTACNQSITSVQSQTSSLPSVSSSELPSSNQSELPSSGSPSGVGQATSSTIPEYGGTLRIITSSQPPNLGWPVEMVGYGTNSQVCLEALLRTDKEGNLIPWLAESYKVADDLKSITFYLRKNIKFHDGSEFNAEAVKWNLDNFLEAKRESLWSSVEIIDDYTVRVNFVHWESTLPLSFGDSDPTIYMVSKVAFEKNGVEWMRANPVGTGPFKFESYQQDVNFKTVKNQDYWIEGKPYLDAIEFIFITDSMTQKSALIAGEGDLLTPIMTAKQANDYVSMGLTTQVSVYMSWILVPDTANTDSPWANQKVREAVEYALDREGLAKAFGQGYWQALYQIPPRYTLANIPDFTVARKYDIEKARQLLTEAGYPDGFKTTIIVNPMGDRDLSVAIQAQLAAAGIKVELQYPENGKWVTYMGSGTVTSNTALFTVTPAIDKYYAGGLQWLFNQLGQSWQRTSELTQALQDSVSSAKLDIEKIRVVTNLMSQNSLLIPTNEAIEGMACQPYVFGYNKPSSTFWQTEEIWLDK